MNSDGTGNDCRTISSRKFRGNSKEQQIYSRSRQPHSDETASKQQKQILFGDDSSKCYKNGIIAIANKRHELGLSLQQAGQALQMSGYSLCRIEKFQQSIGLIDFIKIVAIYNYLVEKHYRDDIKKLSFEELLPPMELMLAEIGDKQNRKIIMELYNLGKSL